jgi:hypothetical protein
MPVASHSACQWKPQTKEAVGDEFGEWTGYADERLRSSSRSRILIRGMERTVIVMVMKTNSTRTCTILDATILVAATAVGLAIVRAFVADGWFFRQEFPISHINFMTQCANEASLPFLASWTLCFLILRLRRPRPRLRRLARQPGMAACSAAALLLIVPLMAIVIPEIYAALKTINLKAALFQAIGFDSGPPAPVPQYGSPTGPATTINLGLKLQAPTAGSVGRAAGEPPSPPAAPTSFFPSVPSLQRPDPHEPFWLWYLLHAIHKKIVPRAYIASAIAGAWLTLVLAGCWRPERTWIDRLGTALGLGWIVVGLGYHGVAFLIS